MDKTGVRVSKDKLVKKEPLVLTELKVSTVRKEFLVSKVQWVPSEKEVTVGVLVLLGPTVPEVQKASKDRKVLVVLLDRTVR